MKRPYLLFVLFTLLAISRLHEQAVVLEGTIPLYNGQDVEV